VISGSGTSPKVAAATRAVRSGGGVELAVDDRADVEGLDAVEDRGYLYGLMAGGERGVERATEILTAQIRRTMALLGVSGVRELQPHHVRID
jgi:hypothetical protein